MSNKLIIINVEYGLDQSLDEIIYLLPAILNSWFNAYYNDRDTLPNEQLLLMVDKLLADGGMLSSGMPDDTYEKTRSLYVNRFLRVANEVNAMLESQHFFDRISSQIKTADGSRYYIRECEIAHVSNSFMLKLNILLSTI